MSKLNKYGTSLYGRMQSRPQSLNIKGLIEVFTSLLNDWADNHTLECLCEILQVSPSVSATLQLQLDLLDRKKDHSI